MRRATPSRGPMFGRDDRRLETRMVELESADGGRRDAMLFRPRDPQAVNRRVGIVVVHGSVGNYLTGVPRRAAFGLAESGYTTLTINTRMANYGVFFGAGLLDRTHHDVDAAVVALRRRGVSRIILLGYSMGATMVCHYQAVYAPPEVEGVCTIAHPMSLPQALRRRWERFGSSPTYAEMTARAGRAMLQGDDPAHDRIVIVTRAKGPTERPQDAEIWTYRTWWHSRGPEALHAESRRWVGILRVPLAIIQAERDPLIDGEEGRELRRLALAGGCPEVHLEYVPGADHIFSGCEQVPFESARAWIARTILGVS
jgi:dienelactone hydrolase